MWLEVMCTCVIVKAINQVKFLVLDLYVQSIRYRTYAGDYEEKHWSNRPGSVNPSQVYCVKASGTVLHKASFRLH